MLSRLLTCALALALLALGADVGFHAEAARPSLCDEVAGRKANPSAFAASLRRGEVGCLREGTYRSREPNIRLATPNVTLTSYPGEHATLLGRLRIEATADGAAVKGLTLDGRTTENRASPLIYADRFVLRDNVITNAHTAICVLVSQYPGAEMPEGVRIEGNRIHDCGVLPATNHEHGIYVSEARGTIIRDNWIYDNADRGVQLYPDADGSLVTGNVIDGNGQGVIFGGDDDDSSDDNLVERNIITNSTIRDNIASHWQGPTGSGNVARENCVWGGSGDEGGGVDRSDGFVAVRNRVARPRFVNPDRGRFELRRRSPCRDLLRGRHP
ncbi:MAG: hypothetical protein GEU88_15510 [Solirubrobacterales bacterium]|nr:hypothetical protein [Solirubrobacterales bacterium]